MPSHLSMLAKQKSPRSDASPAISKAKLSSLELAFSHRCPYKKLENIACKFSELQHNMEISIPRALRIESSADAKNMKEYIANII